MSEWLTFLGVILVSLLLLMAFILVPATLISRATCYASYEDFHPEWGFWSDCRIEWHGKKVPVDILRALEDKGN